MSARSEPERQVTPKDWAEVFMVVGLLFVLVCYVALVEFAIRGGH